MMSTIVSLDWILVLTILCFVGQLASRGVTEALLLSPADVVQGQVWRLVTYAFLHDPQPDPVIAAFA